jgi:hypothetical protein
MGFQTATRRPAFKLALLLAVVAVGFAPARCEVEAEVDVNEDAEEAEAPDALDEEEGVEADEDPGPGPQHFTELRVTSLNKPESCEKEDVVAKGDIVSIIHQGYRTDEDKPVQIDGNPQNKEGTGPEPLQIKIGRGQVIRGMEAGLTGLCLNEEVIAEIPPHMAFDDPSKQFTNKPVAEKVSVMYKMKVVKVEKKKKYERKPKYVPTVLDKIQSWFKNNLATLATFVIIGVGAFVAMNFAGTKSGKGRSRKSKAPKKKLN